MAKLSGSVRFKDTSHGGNAGRHRLPADKAVASDVVPHQDVLSTSYSIISKRWMAIDNLVI